MHPEIISIGGFTLYSYGLALAVSMAAGVWVSARRAVRFGFVSDDMFDAAMPVVVSGLLGAKILFIATNWSEYSSNPWLILASIRGGFVYYGSLFGGVAGAIAWLMWKKYRILPFADAVAPGIALGQAIGRLGCFLNGCCYGGPVSWGVAFPSLGDHIPRHPVQVYESIGTLILALGLARMGNKGRGGRVIGMYLLGYGILRFLLEMMRVDPRGPVLPAGLSVSQAISLAGILIGSILILRGSGTAAKE